MSERRPRFGQANKPRIDAIRPDDAIYERFYEHQVTEEAQYNELYWNNGINVAARVLSLLSSNSRDSVEAQRTKGFRVHLREHQILSASPEHNDTCTNNNCPRCTSVANCYIVDSVILLPPNPTGSRTGLGGSLRKAPLLSQFLLCVTPTTPKCTTTSEFDIELDTSLSGGTWVSGDVVEPCTCSRLNIGSRNEATPHIPGLRNDVAHEPLITANSPLLHATSEIDSVMQSILAFALESFSRTMDASRQGQCSVDVIGREFTELISNLQTLVEGQLRTLYVQLADVNAAKSPITTRTPTTTTAATSAELAALLRLNSTWEFRYASLKKKALRKIELLKRTYSNVVSLARRKAVDHDTQTMDDFEYAYVQDSELQWLLEKCKPENEHELAFAQRLAKIRNYGSYELLRDFAPLPETENVPGRNIYVDVCQTESKHADVSPCLSESIWFLNSSPRLQNDKPSRDGLFDFKDDALLFTPEALLSSVRDVASVVDDSMRPECTSDTWSIERNPPSIPCPSTPAIAPDSTAITSPIPRLRVLLGRVGLPEVSPSSSRHPSPFCTPAPPVHTAITEDKSFASTPVLTTASPAIECRPPLPSLPALPSTPSTLCPPAPPTLPIPATPTATTPKSTQGMVGGPIQLPLPVPPSRTNPEHDQRVVVSPTPELICYTTLPLPNVTINVDEEKTLDKETIATPILRVPELVHSEAPKVRIRRRCERSKSTFLGLPVAPHTSPVGPRTISTSPHPTSLDPTPTYDAESATRFEICPTDSISTTSSQSQTVGLDGDSTHIRSLADSDVSCILHLPKSCSTHQLPEVPIARLPTIPHLASTARGLTEPPPSTPSKVTAAESVSSTEPTSLILTPTCPHNSPRSSVHSTNSSTNDRVRSLTPPLIETTLSLKSIPIHTGQLPLSPFLTSSTHSSSTTGMQSTSPIKPQPNSNPPTESDSENRKLQVHALPLKRPRDFSCDSPSENRRSWSVESHLHSQRPLLTMLDQTSPTGHTSALRQLRQALRSPAAAEVKAAASIAESKETLGSNCTQGSQDLHSQHTTANGFMETSESPEPEKKTTQHPDPGTAGTDMVSQAKSDGQSAQGALPEVPTKAPSEHSDEEFEIIEETMLREPHQQGEQQFEASTDVVKSNNSGIFSRYISFFARKG